MSYASRIPAIAAVILMLTASTWAGEAEDEQAIVNGIKRVWEKLAVKEVDETMMRPGGLIQAGSAGGFFREFTPEQLAAWLKAAPTLRATPYHIDVRFLGSQKDVAYVSYYLVGTIVRGEGEGAISYRTRASNVMEKIDGKWFTAGSHYSTLFGGSGFVTD